MNYREYCIVLCGVALGKGVAVRVALLQSFREYRGGVTVQTDFVKCGCQLRRGIAYSSAAYPRYQIFELKVGVEPRYTPPEHFCSEGFCFIALLIGNITNKCQVTLCNAFLS